MATKAKRKILPKLLVALGLIIAAELIVVLILLSSGRTIALLQPAGTIASQQRDLIVFASVLGLFVIVPVYSLLVYILVRYRDGNVKAKYRPNWDGNKRLELIWWGVPLVIISILAVVTFRTSHSLDPFKPLESSKKPLTIQVVALQWKWLFIYPENNIASVNQLQIPVDRPINFEITSDAPMNSFWIPQLGGQVYAMAGMKTKLHLMASTAGTYDGLSANISGEGFAGMKFKVIAGSEEEFEKWQVTARATGNDLSIETYDKLAEPSKNVPASLYSSIDNTLFDHIIMKYMDPSHSKTSVQPDNNKIDSPTSRDPDNVGGSH